MSFVHELPGFSGLILAVARHTRLAASLVEKDYWITHSLWAMHQAGLAIWFKGGTSLSKGFGIIERFSEDLDLMIEAGTVSTLPRVSSWKSTSKGPTAQRRAFFEALPAAVSIPGVAVELDPDWPDKHARGANFTGRYLGAHAAGLPAAMRPFIRFEVGRARVVPFAQVPLTSYVHDHLDRLGMLGDTVDNRPREVRCVHPMVTLIEKIDAISRRYAREDFEPDAFVRHYEDAARIIQALDRLPPLDRPALDLASEMLADKGIAALPDADDPALLLNDPLKRARVAQACTSIAPMFWGPRTPLDQACGTIRAWVREMAGGR